MTLAALAVLLPINYTSDYYMVAPGEELDQFSSAFMRMTISNVRQRSPRLWCAAAGGWRGRQAVRRDRTAAAAAAACCHMLRMQPAAG